MNEVLEPAEKKSSIPVPRHIQEHKSTIGEEPAISFVDVIHGIQSLAKQLDSKRAKTSKKEILQRLIDCVGTELGEMLKGTGDEMVFMKIAVKASQSWEQKLTMQPS